MSVERVRRDEGWCVREGGTEGGREGGRDGRKEGERGLSASCRQI